MEDEKLDPEELERQEAELLPEREAMSVIDGPLKGPVPLDGNPVEADHQ